MKSTGIIRRVDDLGRIVIPKDIRRRLHIHDGDALEMYIVDGMICYKKYEAEKHLSLDAHDLVKDIQDAAFDSRITDEKRSELIEAGKTAQALYEKLRYISNTF